MSINIILASNDFVRQKEVDLINPDFLTYLRKVKNNQLQLISCLSTYEKTYFNRKQLLTLKHEMSILKTESLTPLFKTEAFKLEKAIDLALADDYYYLILVGD